MVGGLIFDMDGVIIDSNPFHKISWKNFLLRKGLPFSDELFDNVLSGKTGETSLRILIDPDLPNEKIKSYLHEIDSDFQQIFRNAGHVESIPGLAAFLDSVRKAGIKTAMATSAPPGNVDLVMERLNLRGHFDVILDATDVTNGKPDPEIYLTVVKRLGFEKNRCVVFEDSLSGIQSALGAGLRVVGVTTTHTREELLEEGVTMVIDHFVDQPLEEIVKPSI